VWSAAAVKFSSTHHKSCIEREKREKSAFIYSPEILGVFLGKTKTLQTIKELAKFKKSETQRKLMLKRRQ